MERIRSHKDCKEDHKIYFVEAGYTKEVCKTCKHYQRLYGDMCKRDNTFLPSATGIVCKGWKKGE